MIILNKYIWVIDCEKKMFRDTNPTLVLVVCFVLFSPCSVIPRFHEPQNSGTCSSCLSPTTSVSMFLNYLSWHPIRAGVQILWPNFTPQGRPEFWSLNSGWKEVTSLNINQNVVGGGNISYNGRIWLLLNSADSRFELRFFTLHVHKEKCNAVFHLYFEFQKHTNTCLFN